MKKMLTLVLCLIALSGLALANHTEIIGGLRDGVAFGLKTEEAHLAGLTLAYGLEATTGEDFSFSGDNPLIIFGGVELPFGVLGARKIPTFLEIGPVGYFGLQSQVGIYASFMFKHIYGERPLDLEAGFDYFGDHGHVTLQLGYTLYSGLTP